MRKNNRLTNRKIPKVSESTLERLARQGITKKDLGIVDEDKKTAAALKKWNKLKNEILAS